MVILLYIYNPMDVHFLQFHFVSWCLFMQFYLSLRPITSAFLVIDEIKKKRTRMKRTTNMSCVLKVSGKIHLYPWTLKITQIFKFWYLNFFLIQFRYKNLFLLFCYKSSWLREERERSSDFDSKERETLLTPI